MNGQPPEDAVRTQLERILASDGFANAERLRRFLRFIVEGTLEGRGDTLKEYAVGIDVFDRDASYDPRIDSIVRVEARRLRSKLAEYYAAGAGADELIIGLRKGTYMPYFELRAQEPPPKVDSEPVLSASSVSSAANVSASSVAAPLSIAAALAIAGALVWLAWPQVASSGLTASAEPTTVAVLPFAHYSTADGDRLLAGRVTDSMTSALAGFPSLSVRSRTSALQFAESRPTLALVARTLDVRFIVEGSVVAAANGLRLDARLVDAALDRKVWTHELLTTAAQIDATTREMAAAIADELVRRAGRAASTQR